MTRSYHVLSSALFGLGLLALTDNPTQADPFIQTNLVSDIPGLATLTEPTLVNPWGISHSSTSPFWISDQGTSLTNLWSVTGQTNVTKMTAVNPPTGNIAIPTTATGPQGPTGQVNNTNTSSFQLTPGNASTSSRFIFANLNGTISGWAGGPTSTITVTTPGAVYTGLAINQNQTLLYAANSAGAGSIDVFDSTFAPAGTFATPTEISSRNLVPFNVRDINGQVYVTYAPAGRPAQISATDGAGAVAIFNENGVLQRILINSSNSQLAAPWGIALAPGSFGEFASDLLIGNFSFVDSEINAFDLTTGAFIGTIEINPGNGQTPGGLWSLDFGIGGMNGSPNTLYFTDGIDSEMHGLFAAITPVPEPSTLALLGVGVLGLFALRRRRSVDALR